MHVWLCQRTNCKSETKAQVSIQHCIASVSLTSVVLMKVPRTSTITVVLHTGALSVESTEDSSFFSISASASDFLKSGVILYLFPVSLLITLVLTLPAGVGVSSRVISLRSRKSDPLLMTRTSPSSASAPRTFSFTSKFSHEVTPFAM